MFQCFNIPPPPKGEEADKKASKKNLRNQMKEENVINSKCSVCRKKNKGIKKCNGCYSTWYCGQKCQREDWPKHRDQCLKIKSQYRVAKFTPVYVKTLKLADGRTIEVTSPETTILSDAVIVSNGLGGSNFEGGIRKANNNLIKKHFVVKIKKVDMGRLYINNRDRSFRGVLNLKDNVNLFIDLIEKISSEGFQGDEGYFHATLEPGDKEANQFRINPENLFIETWS